MTKDREQSNTKVGKNFPSSGKKFPNHIENYKRTKRGGAVESFCECDG